jgi:hypothetical protein
VTDEERSRETRARAETALVRLLHELRDDEPFLIVLGGLVPDVLTRDAAGIIPEHLGTTDVDVLLITQCRGSSSTVELLMTRRSPRAWRRRLETR